jgi:hypothetical protein
VTVPDDVFSCCCDWGFGIVQGQGIIYEIFAYGGKNTIGATSLATNVGYSITGDSWAVRTNKGTSAVSLTSAAIDGDAYSQGGFTGASINAHNESYNPGSNSWTTKTSLTFARQEPSLMEISDFGILTGGQDSSGAYMLDVEEYDPSGNSWSAKADMPSPARNTHIAAGFDATTGYIFGGFGGAAIADTDEYDRGGDSWASKTSVPENTQEPSACKLGNFIFLTKGDGTIPTTKYDPSGDSWSTVAAYPSPARISAVMVAANSIGYMNHGFASPGTFYADMDSYDPVGDSWASLTSAPSTRAGHGSAAP